MTASVAIVIPARNAAGTLPALLADLAGMGPARDVDIVVVDDASSDATASVAAERAARLPRLHVVAGPGRGPAAARNAGARGATSDWLAFVDADVRLPPDWLARGLAALGDDVDVVEGVVQPQGGDSTGLVRHAAVAGGGGGFVTANLWVRRSSFELVGGFDEGYTAPWREDTDLGWRLVEAGARTRADRHLIVVHPHYRRRVASLLRVGGIVAADTRLRARFPERARSLQPRRELRRSYVTVLLGAAAIVSLAAGRPLVAAGLVVVMWAAALVAALPLVAKRGAPSPGEWSVFVALAPAIAVTRVAAAVRTNAAYRVWFW